MWPFRPESARGVTMAVPRPRREAVRPLVEMLLVGIISVIFH